MDAPQENLTATKVNMPDLRAGCALTGWDGDGEGTVCQVCGQRLPQGKRSVYCSEKCRRWFERNHVWRKARAAAKRRAKYACKVCGAGREARLEVNHITPLVGAGYGVSCAHHADNLDVLCHEHHLLETSRQRKERSAASGH